MTNRILRVCLCKFISNDINQSVNHFKYNV